MLPSVSLPIEKPTSAAAVAAPGPALPLGSFLEKPRVHRLAAEPDVVQRERAEAELGDQHGSGVVKPSTTAASASGTRSRNGSAP